MPQKEILNKIIEILETNTSYYDRVQTEYLATQILSLFPDREEMVKRLKGEKHKEHNQHCHYLEDQSRRCNCGVFEHNRAIDLAIKIIRGEI